MRVVELGESKGCISNIFNQVGILLLTMKPGGEPAGRAEFPERSAPPEKDCTEERGQTVKTREISRDI